MTAAFLEARRGVLASACSADLAQVAWGWAVAWPASRAPRIPAWPRTPLQERLGTTHKVLRQLHKEEKRAQRITGLAASLPGAGGTPLARRPSGTGSAGSAGHRLSSPSARSPAAVSPSVRGLGLPPAPAAVSPSSSMGPSRTSSHDGRTVSLFSRVVGRRG